MKIIDGSNKIVSSVNRVGTKPATFRRAFVSRPDIVEISQKRKLSVYQKIKNFIKNFIKDNFTNLNKQIVTSLENCSLEEFMLQAQKLIIKSYNIPDSLATEIKPLQNINKKIGIMYDFFENTIYVNPKTLEWPRYQLFGFIKHEYTHLKQNYQILRTEELGDKAIEEYARIRTNLTVNAFVNQFSQMTDKEILEMSQAKGVMIPWITELKAAVRKGPKAVEEVKEMIFNNDYPINLNRIKDLRQRVIKEFGIIPKATKEAKISKLYFDGFISLYKNPTDIKANWKALNEQEAYRAQGFANWEYLFHKIF